MDVQQILKQLEGAFAKNTLRAYRADFNDFSQWCASKQLTPGHITSEEIANYIAWMASNRSSATVRRRIATLSSLYKLMDMHDSYPCRTSSDCSKAYVSPKRACAKTSTTPDQRYSGEIAWGMCQRLSRSTKQSVITPGS